MPKSIGVIRVETHNYLPQPLGVMVIIHMDVTV